MNRSSFAFTVGGVVVVAALVLLAESQVSDSRSRSADSTRADTVAETIDLFKAEGFNPEISLKAAAPRIPPVFLAALPDDLTSIRDTERRKAVFVTVVLAHVLWANDRIRDDRARIERLQRANLVEKTLRSRDRKWLERMAKKYRTKPMAFDELLRRVDVVPPRLAVAQAAQESGWGTSRFAQAGNALFGQHAPVGENVIRAKGDPDVALKAFDTLHRSVHGYMQNLNSHRAYRQFRDMRAEMRANGRPLDAFELAGSLGRYSEEGDLYVGRLRTIMRMSEVAAARGARLAEEE
jgi:Bax protein